MYAYNNILPSIQPSLLSSRPTEVYTDFNLFLRWLIGKGGRIYPPSGRPWKTGSEVGCLAGPLFCRRSCLDIGLFEVCYPGDGGGGGEETGPPGFPGGLVGGGGEPDSDPPPYDQPSPDEEPERMTAPDVSKTVDDKTASVKRPAARSASTSSESTNVASRNSASTSSASTSSASKSFGSMSAASTSSKSATGSAAQYYIVATPGADVAGINAFLGQIASKSVGSYAPVFPANTVDGGIWTANLSSDGAASASDRSDISILATYTSTPASFLPGLLPRLAIRSQWI